MELPKGKASRTIGGSWSWAAFTATGCEDTIDGTIDWVCQMISWDGAGMQRIRSCTQTNGSSWLRGKVFH